MVIRTGVVVDGEVISKNRHIIPQRYPLKEYVLGNYMLLLTYNSPGCIIRINQRIPDTEVLYGREKRRNKDS